MIQKLEGKTWKYTSIDRTIDPDDQGQYEDLLNSLHPSGLPPYQLELKKNGPIMVLRNVDPSRGLCNGTRLICRDFQDNVICAEIAVGDHKGQMVFLHRIPLQPSDDQKYPVQFTRTQFPIKLCFAMTINKSQGQTLDKVGIYLLTQKKLAFTCQNQCSPMVSYTLPFHVLKLLQVSKYSLNQQLMMMNVAILQKNVVY